MELPALLAHSVCIGHALSRTPDVNTGFFVDQGLLALRNFRSRTVVADTLYYFVHPVAKVGRGDLYNLLEACTLTV
jgi:hypothetical protein